MSNEFPFTIETFLGQCGGSKEVGNMILDAFLEQVETDTHEMESCLASGDLAQVGKVGHRLKGTAGVLGASNLFSLCLALETAGKAENAEEANKLYPKIKAEVSRCVAAVPETRTRL
ncbi:MAG: Hpt domain-containing protein [Planctomycetaceae bacterium]|jgi:HPt (histidine-containing phosphotransfer) domain-containing protein|nr:Hpt domain-containing protein [Planctomycetaceae bacterium]